MPDCCKNCTKKSKKNCDQSQNCSEWLRWFKREWRAIRSGAKAMTSNTKASTKPMCCEGCKSLHHTGTCTKYRYCKEWREWFSTEWESISREAEKYKKE